MDWVGRVQGVFFCARKRLEVDQQLEVNKDKELDSVRRIGWRWIGSKRMGPR